MPEQPEVRHRHAQRFRDISILPFQIQTEIVKQSLHRQTKLFLKTSQQWHIEQRHGEHMLPEERARLYRRRDGAARRTSRPRKNYCYTLELSGFARAAECRDWDTVTTSLTLNGFRTVGPRIPD